MVGRRLDYVDLPHHLQILRLYWYLLEILGKPTKPYFFKKKSNNPVLDFSIHKSTLDQGFHSKTDIIQAEKPFWGAKRKERIVGKP